MEGLVYEGAEAIRMQGMVYRIEVDNGQRCYGPPVGWNGPPPPKGTEIFVTGLETETCDEDLIALFEGLAPFYCLRIMTTSSGQCRGFCFVRYVNSFDAKRAIKKFDGYMMDSGITLRVAKSMDNRRLFIGKIPFEMTKETLFEIFSEHTEGLMEIMLYNSPFNKTCNRGYCFLEYDSHKSAAFARRRLLYNRISEFKQPLFVNWALPENEIDLGILKFLTTLFIRNLTLETSEDAILSLIGMFVPHHYVTSIKKINNFAFLTCRSHEIAEFLLYKVNGFVFDGVSLDVTWARPTFHQVQNILYSPNTCYAEPSEDMLINLAELKSRSISLLRIYPPEQALVLLLHHWYDKRRCSFEYFNHQVVVHAKIIISKDDVVEFTWPETHCYPTSDCQSARTIVSRAFIEEFILRTPPSYHPTYFP